VPNEKGAIMFKNYLKIAFRNVRKQQIYTFINLIGLAIGLACATLILLWIQDELSYEKFQKNRNNLYAVSMRDSRDHDTRESTSFTVPFAIAQLMKQKFPDIIDFTRVQYRSNFESCVLKYGNKTFYDDGVILVDPSFFRMFTYRFIGGDVKTALADQNSIVITEKIAKKFFGNEEPLGKVLTFNNRQDFKVTAVIQSPPHNSELQFNVVAPIQILGEKKLSGWEWESSSFIQVRNNTDIQKLDKNIAGIIQKYNPIPGMNIIVGMKPLSQFHLYYGNGDISLIYIFISIAAFILLIACINYMNLSTARFSRRFKEVGLRKVLGAQRSGLVKQFLLESVLLSVIALFIAITLVEILLSYFNNITDKNLSFVSQGNLLNILSLIGLAIIVGIVSGIYPAVFLSSFKPSAVIRGTGKFGSKSSLLRTFLVVTQFGIAIILIISTIVIYGQYNYLIHKDLGFNKNHIIYIPINNDLKQKYDSFKNKLLQNPGIRSVTFTSSLPNTIGNVNPIDWEGKQNDKIVFINFSVVDYDYLKTFGIKLSAGRDFSKDIPTDLSNFIVNKKAVELMNLKNPLNTRINFVWQKGIIIGIIDNFNNRPLNEETRPVILTDNPIFFDYFLQYVIIKINSKDISGSLEYIKNVSKEFAPDYPVDFKFLDKTVDNLYQYIQRTWYIFEAFAFLAIFISCLGLFGLASFMIEMRTKEIGVRKTLGASVPGLISLLSGEFTKWVLLANIIACPVAYYLMNKWLQNFAYRIDMSLWFFVLAGGIALAIALATVSFQAIKAATANPVESLRYE